MEKTWIIDPVHSVIGFKVKHMVVTYFRGTFRKFDSTAITNGDNFTDAKIIFTADVRGIQTNNPQRETHLMSDDFFNAEKYPQIKFESTSFRRIEGDLWMLSGYLTIRDATKPVELVVTYGGKLHSSSGEDRIGFEAEGKVNRKDFGLKWDVLTELGGAVVGDEVSLLINVEYTSKS